LNTKNEWSISKVFEAVNSLFSLIDSLSGKRLIEAVIEGKKWPKSLPKVTDPNVATQIAELLLQAHYFHHSEKVKEKKGYLKVGILPTFSRNSKFILMSNCTVSLDFTTEFL
jgi:hypothetical protein